MDILAQRTNLTGRVPAERLEFYDPKIALLFNKLHASSLGLEKKKIYIGRTPTQTFLEQLQLSFSNVEIQSCLLLNGLRVDTDKKSGEKIDIIELLKNNKKKLRFVSNLELVDWPFFQSLESVILSLCTTFPRLQRLKIASCELIDIDVALSNTAFSPRKWKKLVLCNNQIVDESSLMGLIDNCENISISPRAGDYSMSLKCVVKAFKKCVFENVPAKRLVFTSSISTFESLDQFEESLKAEVPGVRIEDRHTYPEDPFHSYVITHKTEGKDVEFKIPIRVHTEE